MENNAFNNNLTDLAYNNTASGQPTGFILGLDLSSAQVLNLVRLYDWNATYIATTFEVIGTNDASGATYDVLHTETGHQFTGSGSFKEISFNNSTAYRYYGLRCVTPNNASFWVVSEIDFFSGSTVGPFNKLLTGSEVTIIDKDPTTVSITTEEDRDIKIVIMGA